MKKKIIIGLGAFCLIFLLGAVYLVFSIERATSTLSNLVMLHQAEIVRENLMINIKRVQADLSRQDTPYARDFDTIVFHVRTMKKAADECFNCHHSGVVTARLTELNNQIEMYKRALSRIFTISANAARIESETDNAYKVGDQLSEQLSDMLIMADVNLEKKTKTVLGKINDTKFILFSLIGVAPFIAAGLSLFFIRGITKPIDEMLNATRRLEGGDLDYRIGALQDEFGEVAASFNNMVSSLKEQMEKMQRTEQMVVFGEYAAKLAHDIQSPLAGIKVSLEVLPDKVTLPEKERELLSRIGSELGRIESLLENLLDFARPPKPQFMPVEVSKILASAVNFSRKRQPRTSKDAREIEIVNRVNEDLPKITADPMQLQQVFLNLLNNSFEAMPDGGTLTISAAHDAPAKTVEIEISDTGRGIEDDLLAQIFQPFFTTKAKGTGLGLAISKQLIEQNGGAIAVSSSREGGATFRVTLPADGEREAPGI
ncbi:MAG: HAMP domain-containing protein [Deltaproteobacteria bacterium]|nr:HAMP domain-containing protein [Deltaproteobacteria bacterium]NIS78226.1 HAMP domain-containing protein [Deltaproteobacteria bacterium]